MARSPFYLRNLDINLQKEMDIKMEKSPKNEHPPNFGDRRISGDFNPQGTGKVGQKLAVEVPGMLKVVENGARKIIFTIFRAADFAKFKQLHEYIMNMDIIL